MLSGTNPTRTVGVAPSTVRLTLRRLSPCATWINRARFPSRAAGTLVPLAAARATFPKLPQVNFRNGLNELGLRDHWVEPPIESTAYPVFVQSTDADGNAVGGIRHPLLEAPRTTHTGWSLRASGFGM